MISQFDVLSDPTSATGYALANTLRDDGVHIGLRGAYLVAKPIAAWLTSTFPNLNNPLPVSVIDRRRDTAGAVIDPTSDQYFRNPLLTTVAANLATGVTVVAGNGMPAGVPSIAARTLAADGDAYGNNQAATFATASAGSLQRGSIVFTGTSSDIPAGVNRARFGVMVSTTEQTNFIGLRLAVDISTSNYGTIVVELKTNGDSNAADNTVALATELIERECLLTPLAEFPSDAVITGVTMTVMAFVAGHPGSFTLTAGRPMMHFWHE